MASRNPVLKKRPGFFAAGMIPLPCPASRPRYAKRCRSRSTPHVAWVLDGGANQGNVAELADRLPLGLGQGNSQERSHRRREIEN